VAGNAPHANSAQNAFYIIAITHCSLLASAPPDPPVAWRIQEACASRGLSTLRRQAQASCTTVPPAAECLET
jgi:hypothetical protein